MGLAIRLVPTTRATPRMRRAAPVEPRRTIAPAATIQLLRTQDTRARVAPAARARRSARRAPPPRPGPPTNPPVHPDPPTRKRTPRESHAAATAHGTRPTARSAAARPNAHEARRAGLLTTKARALAPLSSRHWRSRKRT